MNYDYTIQFGLRVKEMKEKDIVKFKSPSNEDEKEALMVVRELRGERVLVSDLRFSGWSVPPTSVYAASDLEIVTDSAENKA